MFQLLFIGVTFIRIILCLLDLVRKCTLDDLALSKIEDAKNRTELSQGAVLEIAHYMQGHNITDTYYADWFEYSYTNFIDIDYTCSREPGTVVYTYRLLLSNNGNFSGCSLNTTVKQVMIRWSLQCGYAVVLKLSSDIQNWENSRVFDIELDEKEMETLVWFSHSE